MSSRTDLNAHTWIEGGKIHTTCSEVAASWVNREGVDTKCHDFKWRDGSKQDRWGVIDEYNISLTDVAPVYEYQRGEPWAAYYSVWADIHCGIVEELPEGTIIMARRAAIVCDTAEQFKALFNELGISNSANGPQKIH